MRVTNDHKPFQNISACATQVGASNRVYDGGMTPNMYQLQCKTMTCPYLELIRHILLIEGVEADKLKALCHHVEQLVVGLGAHRHLVRPDLRRHTLC